jgi:hypothetical protein
MLCRLSQDRAVGTSRQREASVDGTSRARRDDLLEPWCGTMGDDPGREAEAVYGSGVVPGLNPIEQAWSKLKTHLRAKAARSLEALEAELGPAPRHHHRPGRPGLVPPRRLPGSPMT